MASDRGTRIINVGPEAIASYGVCGYKDRKNPGFQRKLECLAGRRCAGIHGHTLEAPPHFQLLVKRFDPDVAKSMDEICRLAREEFEIDPTIVQLSYCHAAQDSLNPYGTFSVLWNGELVADHAISGTRFRNIMNRVLG